MHQDNLRFYYREYKNCLKNEFSNYFSKDDYYKSYLGRCSTQQNDILSYATSHFNKISDASYEREDDISRIYEANYTKFGKHGWNGAQVKN
jgi:hypothetical protein